MKTVITKKHGISYKEYGSGKTIILLPSLFLSSYSYATIGKLLGNYYHVIIPDLHRGKSTYSKINYSFDDYAKELFQFTSALKIRKFSLMGISFSTFIAIYYASKYPKTIKHLLLFSTTLVPEEIPNKWKILFTGYSKLLSIYMQKSEGRKIWLLWFTDGLQTFFLHPRQTFWDNRITAHLKALPLNHSVHSVLIYAAKDEFLPKGHIEKQKKKSIPIKVVEDYHAWMFLDKERFVEMVRNMIRMR